MKKEKKILILDATGKDWTDQHLRNKNVDVYAVYHQIPLFLRAIRRLYFYSNLPKKNIWYDKWKNQLQHYDVIIIFSAILGNEIFSWIRKQGYKGKLIFYYRDHVDADYLKWFAKPNEIRKAEKSVDLWSFDPDDAKIYSMKYNPQFYFYLPEKNAKIKYDVVFVGATNGRLNHIMQAKRMFENLGLKVFFHIKYHHGEKISKQYQQEVTDKLLSYDEILELDRSSKAILEINQSGQSGLTMRALEALFLKRKLITTNVNIKNTSLYNKNNIFLLKVDNTEQLKAFLQSPFDKTDFDWNTEFYECKTWLRRFL